MLGCLSSGILVDLFSPGFQWKFSEIVNFTGNHWNSDVNFSGGGGGALKAKDLPIFISKHYVE